MTPDRLDAGSASGRSTSRRVAAILAMACLLAALATAVAAVLSSTPERILALLACLVVATVGLWYVVARHGLPRALSVTAVIAGAVGFALLALTAIRRFRGWTEWSASSFEVDSSAPIEVGIDGESVLLDPPLEFESLPGRLRVRIPARAPGFAPAASAVALDRTLVSSLVAVALGRR